MIREIGDDDHYHKMGWRGHVFPQEAKEPWGSMVSVLIPLSNFFIIIVMPRVRLAFFHDGGAGG